MTITRRNALMSAGAAAMVAGVPGGVQGEDAVLLARVAQFHETCEAFRRSWRECSEYREKVEAMPNCPSALGPWGDLAELRTRNKAHHEFLGARGVWDRYDEPNRINEQVGALVNAVFKTPAQTTKGALEKLKIAYVAVGDGEGTGTGDNDLEAFQDLEEPWMVTVIADFERLIGGIRP